MDLLEFLRAQVRAAHEFFEATVADVTSEQARWIPQGVAHPIGSRYAHLVVGEDILVNNMLRQAAPLFATTWAGKTGVSEPRLDAPLEWARTVKVDLTALRDYMHAVFTNTDEFLASLKPEDLEGVVDLSQAGAGKVLRPHFIGTYVIGHAHDVAGEISILKGMLGMKGYPA